MACKESDDKTSILAEISRLRKKAADLNEDLYLVCNKRRLINHRIADLEYELRNGESHELDG